MKSVVVLAVLGTSLLFVGNSVNAWGGIYNNRFSPEMLQNMGYGAPHRVYQEVGHLFTKHTHARKHAHYSIVRISINLLREFNWYVKNLSIRIEFVEQWTVTFIGTICFVWYHIISYETINNISEKKENNENFITSKLNCCNADNWIQFFHDFGPRE